MIMLFILSVATLALSSPISQLGSFYNSPNRKELHRLEGDTRNTATVASPPRFIVEETTAYKRILIPLNSENKSQFISFTSPKINAQPVLIEAAGAVHSVVLHLQKSDKTHHIRFPFEQQYGWQKANVVLPNRNQIESISIEVNHGKDAKSRDTFSFKELEQILVTA